MHLFFKRAFDLSVAGAALCASAPVMAATALAVRLSMGAPVLFRQARPGKHGKIFTALKFRTMRDAVGSDGVALPDEERLTAVGELLRKTSLDELPQLLNVVKGEMSLVGPRPLLVRYLERYSAEQARRHDVLPGITGWAQVHGRNATSWDDRFANDVWYVENWSLALDVKILAATVLTVVRREGISEEGAGVATMREFLG
ncbi:MAG: sugar transferase [Deltaproteobacteria bacterium]|nr:sugar transferase [Deltaproteobacteria bacterium]